MWESRKLRLYGENACPGPQPNSSGWNLGQDGKLWNRRNGRSGKLSHSDDMMHVVSCSNDVCGSAHCGCVVNGNVACSLCLYSIILCVTVYVNSCQSGEGCTCVYDTEFKYLLPRKYGMHFVMCNNVPLLRIKLL